MRSGSIFPFLGWSCLALALLAVQGTLRAPRGLLWQSIFDAGHVLLFAALSLMLLQISLITVRLSDRRRHHHYFLSFGGVVVLAVLTEALQIHGPRDADLGDGLRNLAGGASALLLANTSDGKGRRQLPWRRALVIIGALVMLVLPTVPVATTAAAYVGRDRAFPVLCTFSGFWEEKFVSVKDGSLAKVSCPAGWGRPGSASVAKITLLPAPYPGLSIKEPRPDWTGYDLLALDVFSEMPHQFELVLRVDDAHHNNAYEDRFNRSIVITPGQNALRLTLSEVKDGPAHREMDLKRIRGLALFANHPMETITFFVDEVRLERQ